MGLSMQQEGASLRGDGVACNVKGVGVRFELCSERLGPAELAALGELSDEVDGRLRTALAREVEFETGTGVSDRGQSTCGSSSRYRSPDLSGTDPRICCFCRLVGDAQVQGRLLCIEGSTWAHVNCLCWSRGVYHTSVGDVGLLCGVQRVMQRAARIICRFCGCPGATITCSAGGAGGECHDACHFGCALLSGWLFYPRGGVLCSACKLAPAAAAVQTQAPSTQGEDAGAAAGRPSGRFAVAAAPRPPAARGLGRALSPLQIQDITNKPLRVCKPSAEPPVPARALAPSGLSGGGSGGGSSSSSSSSSGSGSGSLQPSSESPILSEREQRAIDECFKTFAAAFSAHRAAVEASIARREVPERGVARSSWAHLAAQVQRRELLLRVGSLEVRQLGRLPSSAPGYQTSHALYPPGFVSRRLYFAPGDAAALPANSSNEAALDTCPRRAVYTCRILEGQVRDWEGGWGPREGGGERKTQMQKRWVVSSREGFL